MFGINTRSPSTAAARGRRRSLTLIAALTSVGAMLIAMTFPSTASAAVPGPPSGWSTVFSDDFNGSAGSGVNTSTWLYDTGTGFGTGEVETMTNSTNNVHLDGSGDLDITALKSGSSWTSGRIQTTSANVGAPAGGELEVTASIEQPSGGVGYWPAFWMLGPGQWPENGEIDIMEDVNSLSEVSGTIHCGTDPGGPCNEGNGIGSGLKACSGCQSGYHTYSMILNRTNTSAESITFYLDGSAYFTVNESQVGTSTWQAAFDHNLSIIFDLAMGGAYPNGVCGCTSPTSSTASGKTMSVQYVAAYTTTSGGTTPPPPAGTIVGNNSGLCLSASGGSTALKTTADIDTCNGSGSEKWTVNSNGTIVDGASGLCLSVTGASTTVKATADLYTCNGSASESWTVNSSGTIVGNASGLCLSVTGAATTPGATADLYTCNNSVSEFWTVN